MRVIFLTATLTHYRVAFHEQVRTRLSDQNVSYELIYGQPATAEATKGDTVDLGWAKKLPNRFFQLNGRTLVWQPVIRHLRRADLVVLGQENRLLLNYGLQLMRSWGAPRIALWGHGRNFQARKDSAGELWKCFWATRCDWWFAYTEETRQHIEALGFPAERITVFNNAMDTSELRRLAIEVTPARLEQKRNELDILGTNVGIYVGGLYDEKRLDFLVDAADRVRRYIVDFELVIVGGGPAAEALTTLAAMRPWIKLTGPRFGIDKVELMKLGKLFLMPGLVGLAILDAGALGLPTVTTAYPYHSPEIAYLDNGVNGLIVEAWRDPQAFADAVVDLLRDRDRLARMSLAARQTAAHFTIEAMADRFVEGALKALAL